MRRLLMATALISTLATPAWAETIHVGVDGMVCAFCAVGIEKSFKREAAVDSVKVELESKLVTVNTKPKQTLDDKVIASLITEAGYKVTAIHRQN